jgi:hypothetical protein
MLKLDCLFRHPVEPGTTLAPHDASDIFHVNLYIEFKNSLIIHEAIIQS